MRRAFLKPQYHNPEGDKACYEAWTSEGTLLRAKRKLENSGFVSGKGKPFATIDGIRKAAVRYMINHYDESRQMLLDTYAESGYIVGEDAVDRFMIRMAVSTLLKPERVKFWLIEHGLYGKQKDYTESLIHIPDDE